MLETTGNDACHVILRGSNTGTNYDSNSIAAAAKLLEEAKLPQRLMIDCSHGNSAKDHLRQALVVESICEQISHGSKFICGVMIESNLIAGKQPLHHGKDLIYGQSITDACISWEHTKPLLKTLAEAVKLRRS